MVQKDYNVVKPQYKKFSGCLKECQNRNKFKDYLFQREKGKRLPSKPRGFGFKSHEYTEVK